MRELRLMEFIENESRNRSRSRKKKEERKKKKSRKRCKILEDEKRTSMFIYAVSNRTHVRRTAASLYTLSSYGTMASYNKNTVTDNTHNSAFLLYLCYKLKQRAF